MVCVFSGSGIKDTAQNVLDNQRLVIAFLRSAQPLLASAASAPGEIHVTIKKGMHRVL